MKPFGSPQCQTCRSPATHVMMWCQKIHSTGGYEVWIIERTCDIQVATNRTNVNDCERSQRTNGQPSCMSKMSHYFWFRAVELKELYTSSLSEATVPSKCSHSILETANDVKENKSSPVGRTEIRTPPGALHLSQSSKWQCELNTFLMWLYNSCFWFCVLY